MGNDVKADDKKVLKVLNKIGIDSPAEIIDVDKFDKLINNLSKLPIESLESFVSLVPNFKDITKQYFDNLNLSYNKVMDDLIFEKTELLKLLNKENITDPDKVIILNEIREIRRTIIARDVMYNVMNNKAFQFCASVTTVVVTAVIGSKLKK